MESSLIPDFWLDVRSKFSLDFQKIHLALNMIGPNPICVQDEIGRHRKSFDENPAIYYREKDRFAALNLESLARYLKTKVNQISITESTTAGLSVILNGLAINPGNEI